MRNKEPSVSVTPIVSKGGVGATVNASNSSGSINVGGFKSKQSTNFWASAEKPVGNSSSVGFSAAASSQGHREVGVSFKKNF